MLEGRNFAAASTLGGRARQEDDWGTHVNPPACEPHARLLVAVVDGMGGLPAGDRASSIALRTFLDSYRLVELSAAERMRHALAHANREVGIAAEADPELEGMGCTLVAALIFPDRCEWLSVGDSLILLVRDGSLTRVNPLHIYAHKLDELVHRGELSEEAARAHPERAALTSAIQGTVLEEVAQGVLALEAGDLLICASDGILTLTNEEIVSTCAEQAEHGAESVARAIMHRIDAADQPDQDNATLVVVCHDPMLETIPSCQIQESETRQPRDEHAGDCAAGSRHSSGEQSPGLVQDEQRQCAVSTDGIGDAPSSKNPARSIAATTVTHARGGSAKRVLAMRGPSLAVGFVLGVLCAAVGFLVFLVL